MAIDGKEISETILQKLQSDVAQLKNKGVTPTLAIILVGDNPASMSYIRQKEKTAYSIGAKTTIFRFPSTVKEPAINETIRQCNDDSSIHGIVLQIPLPPHFDVSINRSISRCKDVDGFVQESEFIPPVAKATERILHNVYDVGFRMNGRDDFFSWLKMQHIVILGRGVTAGKPIMDFFIRQEYTVSVVHSQTTEEDKQRRLQKADIIISCVGKEKMIIPKYIKKGVILISVGIWRDENGKLHGDYEEGEIKDIASFYTPTPGGVGPVNVACLMENLVFAASLKT